MAALAAHEAVPGHHLQVALAMELDGLPEIRRFGGFTAYVEGWALYAERLAETMGVYQIELDRVGMVLGQMRRAIRLVVDTGIHAMRWSRARAIAFEVDAVQISEEAAANDIDRYASWPGQALAYMVGRMEIERLRDEAKKALGARFDLRAFHDIVLGSGAVPLETLETIVRAWIGRGR